MIHVNIQEHFFPASLERLIPGKNRTFPLYIYFQLNEHMLLRFGDDYDLTRAVLDKHIRLGITQLWCPVRFREEWEKYLARVGRLEEQAKAAIAAGLTPEQIAAAIAAGDPALSEFTAEEMLAAVEAAKAKALAEAEKLTAQAAMAKSPEEAAALADAAAKAREEAGLFDETTQALRASGAEAAAEAAASEAKEKAAQEAAEAAAAKLAEDPKAAEQDEAARKKIEEPPIEPSSEESALAIAVMSSESLDREQKKAMLSEIGTDMLSALGEIDGEDPEKFKEGMKKCKKFVQDVVQVAAQNHKMREVLEDIKLLSENEIEHSTTVATLSVIFGMCAGHSEMETLSDLAFASFLHDVGGSFLDPSLLGAQPVNFTPEQATEYRRHIELGLEFLDKSKLALTPGVRELITQHHERFNGKGFPEGLGGFRLSELPQLIGIADLLSDLLSGAYDGTVRAPVDALAKIQELQMTSGRPEFNPELFATIIQAVLQSKGPQSEAENLVQQVTASI